MSTVEERQAELRERRRQIHLGGLEADGALDQIAYWMYQQEVAEKAVVAFIDQARSEGHKWWEIGAMMGRTGEAARAYRKYHEQP